MGLITRGIGREVEYTLVDVYELRELGRKYIECYELKPKIQTPKELKPKMSGREIKQ